MNPSRSCINRIFAIMAVIALAWRPQRATSFQLQPSQARYCSSIRSFSVPSMPPSSLVILHSENPKLPSDEEEVIGDQYEGSVDWDAEWKKVVANKDQPTQRPGKYKSQVEISAIKATNKVAKNVFDASKDMQSKMPAAPSMRSLQGDWRVSGLMLVSRVFVGSLCLKYCWSKKSLTLRIPADNSFGLASL